MKIPGPDAGRYESFYREFDSPRMRQFRRALWMTTAWHHVPYTVVALLGVAALLLTRVLSWEGAERPRGLGHLHLVRRARAHGRSARQYRGHAAIGSGHVTHREWWSIGFVISLVTLAIRGTPGLAWWKLPGWW